ncbi:MAG: asparagine synthase (glutamine-hydrolyzing) [bacterium]|nr:asparagine synthase (glutamine-hydrolyzing) [bacterium]
MCGICGIIGPQSERKPLERMLQKQQHRGPDYTGIWLDEHVALGHNRLSILDLSPSSHQPFVSIDNRFVLVFNGEIYNYLELKAELETKKYRFSTTSDTEVLLAAYQAWGEDCLQKLNGMFAFAIWDRQRSCLFAARDRFGVKPFYYSWLQNSFVFASEIPTLWEAGIPKQASEPVWASFFAFGSYGLPNETFWKDIVQLSAGHSLTLGSNGALKIRKWYHFADRVRELQHINRANEENYITELLNSAIRLRFRADVPVGFNLSGGLDSSTLLSLVHHAYPNDEGIEAFTFFTGDDRYDELPWVEMMLNDKVYPLNKCLLGALDVAKKAKKMALHQAEPFGGVPTLAYAEVFKRAREKGILVLLDGQGSDEAWAGYDYYLKQSDAVVQGIKSSPLRPNVLQPDFLNQAVKPNYEKPFQDDLLNKQYRDLFYTKIPRALRFNDRVSMLYSTELREPFLDYRLVEYIFSRPYAFKVRNGNQKWLLRKIASGYLGSDIALAPKRPLQTPQREWLGEALKPWVAEQIEYAADTSWFNKKLLQKEVENYNQGNKDNSFFLWQWVNTGLLHG